MFLTDSHAHLDFYTETPTDRDEVLRRAHAAGVHTILAIGIGDGPATMHHALDIANEIANATNSPIYRRSTPPPASTPRKPHQATPEALAKLTTLAADPNCIAIGEIGLDYYHLDNPDIPTQQAAFIAQM